MDKDFLRPRSKQRVMDLLRQTGMDVSDWANYGDGKKPPAANPKYCYEWSFRDDRRLVVNLWYEGLKVDTGTIVYRGNFREDARQNKLNNPNKPWANRARKLDEHIREAVLEGLTVRAIINEGKPRSGNAAGTARAAVNLRELDAEPWSVGAYDDATGECMLVRGALRFVDQFSLRDVAAQTDRVERTGMVYVRDGAVRKAVLARAHGRCEFCGVLGFKMADGSRYVETHHIVPLCEAGEDHTDNVIALCPNHHREAHHAEHKHDLQAAFLEKLGKG